VIWNRRYRITSRVKTYFHFKLAWQRLLSMSQSEFSVASRTGNSNTSVTEAYVVPSSRASLQSLFAFYLIVPVWPHCCSLPCWWIALRLSKKALQAVKAQRLWFCYGTVACVTGNTATSFPESLISTPQRKREKLHRSREMKDPRNEVDNRDKGVSCTAAFRAPRSPMRGIARGPDFLLSSLHSNVLGI